MLLMRTQDPQIKAGQYFYLITTTNYPKYKKMISKKQSKTLEKNLLSPAGNV